MFPPPLSNSVMQIDTVWGLNKLGGRQIVCNQYNSYIDLFFKLFFKTKVSYTLSVGKCIFFSCFKGALGL